MIAGHHTGPTLTDIAAPSSPTFLQGIGLRQLRLAAGLVLFVYLLSHFANHALGNISLAAMGAGLEWHLALWRSLPATILLYGALVLHLALGLYALYERREFRWKGIEIAQILFGFSIPLMIAGHVISIRLGSTLFDHQKDYPQAFFAYWVYRPYMIWVVSAALIVAWTHGCIGLYFWLRTRPLFKKFLSLLLALAVLLPMLSLLGLYQGGGAVTRASASPEWQAENLGRDKVGTAAEQVALDQIISYSLYGYGAAIILVFIARGLRSLNERRGGLIKLSYGDGRSIRMMRGLSVLEASLRHNIPHSSVCGGRARCSTCRIRVVGDCNTLPQPSNREAFVLDRVGAGGDPAIRLACQLRPTDDISFFRIFPPGRTATSMSPVHAGKERYLVCMFVDLRGSTRLAERLLPFDTVFIINRFLTAVSRAVVESGGRPNQFVGDGQLALFGLNCDPVLASRQALNAASLIAEHVDELNKFLGKDVPEPLRFGIGIHGGEVIIGDIGSQDHTVFTALGDPVNVTARLQDMTKALSCEVVFSDEVRGNAGLADGAYPQTEIDIRGRAGKMIVRMATDARTIARDLSAIANAAA